MTYYYSFRRPFQLLLLTGLFLSVSTNFATAQTVVNSLSALKPYLDDNNANVKLAPGTYTITGDDVRNGEYPEWTQIKYKAYALFLFEGNNSTYDFTGVTINIDTDVLDSYDEYDNSYDDQYHLHFIGNNNVVKNLTLADVGSVYDVPDKGCTSVVMDGSGNRLEGMHLTVKGSYPYGYGDWPGKGGPSTIPGITKHSGVLIRGFQNHLKNCTIIQRSYGHIVFMQAADEPLIEGCYIEGEMRSTDDMLAEAGTGTPGDDADFETSWGYTLPGGYMMSLQEEGIRAYNGGETLINGVRIDREAMNVTVRDCTVKNARGGITLAHASGDVYVENCTVIGCEQAFALGSGDVVNCYADAAYGPVYQSTYNSDHAFNADITILPADEYYNGSKHIAYIGSNYSNVILRGGDANMPSNMSIAVGGNHPNIRFLYGNASSQNNHEAYFSNITNKTPHPITVASGCDGNDIASCGSVTDYGTSTSISSTSCDTPGSGGSGGGSCGNFNAYATIQAEDFCSQSGVQVENKGQSSDNIGFIQDGDWIKFDDVEFGSGAQSVDISVSSGTSGGSIEFRLGSTSGSLMGTANVSGTGGWSNWQTATTSVSGATGTQDLYLVFTGGSGYLFNVDHFEFTQSTGGGGGGGSTGTNIALNKTATQSSNYSSTAGLASNAVDGNTSGVWNTGSVTHTATQTNPWWEVDLGGSYDVDDIVIWNRTNCCMDRLTYFTVSLIDGSTTTFSQSYSSYPNPSVTVNAGGATGDVVRIQLNDTNPLSLAEVQVYGTASSGGGSGGSSGGDFQLVKRNATGFAIDGGSTLEGRSVELYTYVNHNNLTWTEIDRGGGYYSYQKKNTSLCMDGGSGGSDGQDVTTETCNANDYGQHWEKIDAGNGHYRLQKRGTNYSLDGGNNGQNDQNVYLWTSSSSNQNQQWRFDGASGSRKGEDTNVEEELRDTEVSLYPNPVTDLLTVNTPAGVYHQYVIYNLNGKVKAKGTVLSDVSELQLDMSNMRKGMYMLSFYGVDNTKVIKVVKQ